MSMGVYDVGALVTLSAAFTVGTVATDPTTVTCQVRDPSGAVTTLTATKASTGNYTATLDLTAAKAGVWNYRWQGSGACQAAEEAQFYVEASAF